SITTMFFVALMAMGVNAQDWSSDVYKMGEQYPGYVITKDGKKIEGYIKYQNRYTMQNEVLFFAEKGNRKSKTKYATKDLQEYKVADKLYHCITYSGGLSQKAIRANLVVSEGCITQYVWYNRAEGYAVMQRGSNESEEEFLERMYPSVMVFKNTSSGVVKSVDQFGLKFAKKMSEFVSEQPALSKKVASKQKGYGMLKILDIIAEYNENC
ncbi:MAG: hypothetical protein AAF193_03355, partial [Bacteroidota bacterium]